MRRNHATVRPLCALPPPLPPHGWRRSAIAWRPLLIDTVACIASAGKRRKLQVMTYTQTVHDDHRNSIDHTWILVAGLICFFLQAGFALLEAGAVRAKNAKNIALKNLMDACIGGVVYYLFGYALAYGSTGDGTGNPFIGGETGTSFMLNNVAVLGAGNEYYGFFFQYVFAATTATIVSGAVAERIKFSGYIVYSVILTGVIYPICSHWIWSADGFLNQMGVIDYAGGGAVHSLSGVAAFCGAAILGPRIGRFDDNGKPKEIPPHNVSMMALGVFVLWFGFIPFNAGSGVTMLDWMAGQTGRIATSTTGWFRPARSPPSPARRRPRLSLVP